ncbi:MAG TPA: Flp family type IVb pilin [Shinella sp.]|jgi:pilus assembly protein Flp/PilA|uniref:Flp family type IVb pilin n=1 Tax=Shinella sp. TaxID=1870904 RepID=UPI0029BDFCC3|nr:Flp family type IVb pilin [Shinella sp.]MDX3975097.1 Flp family type IVb pilin [Shinella sp.]HEV7248282.1 Flp family type IVb pilin [Shinella sp.]
MALRLLKSFCSDRDGGTAVEYGLLLALISIGLLLGLESFQNGLSGTFSTISNSIDSAGKQ